MNESKTYVFGNDGNNSLAALAPALSNLGMNPAMLMSAMNNNGGFGGNGAWWVIILLFALWGRNGFGGNNEAGTERILSTLNGDTGRDMILSAVQGNSTAISQLSSTLNCDIQTLTSGLCDIRSAIQMASGDAKLSNAQVINAVQAGDASLGNQLAQCCCTLRESITTQGYENRIASTENTALLVNKLDNQTTLINDKFCQLEMREMQSKIDALRESNSNLKAQVSQEHQTAQLQAYQAQTISPLASALSGLSQEIASIKCKLPETVTLPANTGTYITPCQQTLLGLANFNPNNCGFGFWNNGSIWG